MLNLLHNPVWLTSWSPINWMCIIVGAFHIPLAQLQLKLWLWNMPSHWVWEQCIWETILPMINIQTTLHNHPFNWDTIRIADISQLQMLNKQASPLIGQCQRVWHYLPIRLWQTSLNNLQLAQDPPPQTYTTGPRPSSTNIQLSGHNFFTTVYTLETTEALSLITCNYLWCFHTVCHV